MKYISFLIFFLSVIPICSSQSQGNYATAKQGNVWYFGNGAGLDFNSGTPSVIGNNGFANYSQEGSAVACDASGSILFYTDGSNIYNSNHAIMTNGSGLNSHYSTTQSAQIIPRPGSTVEYYVFHLEDTYSPTPSRNGELYYSIVDISANGGLGAVTSKNNLMHGGSQHVEGMDVAYHANDTDIWLITHAKGNSTFYIDLITSGGITSSTQSIGGNFSSFGGLGAFRFSPDGSKFASINNNLSRTEVFNFNDATGTLSSRKKVNNYTSFNAYGVAFSENGNTLYVSGNRSSGSIYGILYQYDLTAGSAANIQATQTEIANGASGFVRFSGLRLGPDDKIYVTHFLSSSNSLSVINNPNNTGAACNLNLYSINLGTGTGRNVPEYFIPVENPLPIELVAFNATCNNGDAYLTWETASETNNDYFEIQYTENGMSYEIIGYVDGAGTSLQSNYYHFEIDPRYANGYFRLNQVDFDGSQTYSGIIHSNCASNDIQLHMSGDIIWVTADKPVINVEIRDVMGRILYNGAGPFISLETYSSGKYIIRASTQNQTQLFRILK